MAGLSKEKGSRFERAICQQLSLWVTNREREDVFWRAAMSGGRVTVASRKGRAKKFTAQSGDISATHRDGHLLLELFVIECKFYKSLRIEQTVWGRKGLILDWWAELNRLGNEISKHPMLIGKENRRETVVGLDSSGMEILRAGVEFGPRVFRPVFTFPRLDLNFFLLSEMFTQVDFNVIREVYDDGTI